MRRHLRGWLGSPAFLGTWDAPTGPQDAAPAPSSRSPVGGGGCQGIPCCARVLPREPLTAGQGWEGDLHGPRRPASPERRAAHGTGLAPRPPPSSQLARGPVWTDSLPTSASTRGSSRGRPGPRLPVPPQGRGRYWARGPLRMSAGLCLGPAGPAAPPPRPPSDAPSKPWPDPDWDEQAVTIPSPARVPDTSKADASSRGPRPGCPLHLLGHQPGCGRRAEFHVQSDPPSDQVTSAVHAFSCPGLRGPGRQPRQPGVPLPAAPPADETLGLRHPCEVR